MLCPEWREISLVFLLVNCHDVTVEFSSSEFRAKQVLKVL